MPQTIDERIVEMRIDNDQFERGAKTTLNTLEKLRNATNFGGLQSAMDGFSTDSMSDAFTKLEKHVDQSVNGIVSVVKRGIGNEVYKVFHDLAGLVNSFTLAPIGSGFKKFGEKTTAVSTLVAQGYELEKVNELMDQLNWFTDETSYNFTDMVGNIAKFTATGQDLDKSVTAMEGIALWAAVSGQNAQKASMAMYQLSQAMTKGALKMDDFKSIQNASMDTKEFREQAVAAAEALGTLKKVGDNTWKTLTSSAKAEKELEKKQSQLEDANMALSQAQKRLAQAKTEAAADSAAYAVQKAQKRVSELVEAVNEAQAALSSGFSLSELFSSKGLTEAQWLTSDVMMEVYGNYAKAVSEIQRYIDNHDGIDTATEAINALEEEATNLSKTLGISLNEAFAKLGYEIDEFSLKAFKAGQQARTWKDVVDSIKDATSTGWMNVFETIIGDADGATKFWSGVAEELYNIFMGPLDRIRGYVNVAFGSKEAATGWSKFEKQLQDAGTTETAFIEKLSAVLSNHGRDVDDIIEQYGSLENALKKGAITADEFREALASLETSGSEQLAESAEVTVESLEERIEKLREVALQVRRGEWGNGQERIDALEAAGYNAELIQRMAEWTHFGNSLAVDYLSREYPTLLAMIQEEIVATGNVAAGEIDRVNGLLESSDEYWKMIQEETEEIASELLPNMKKKLRDAEADVLQVQKEIAEKGIDINKTVYGNIDTNSRQILMWTEENLKKYEKELESWGLKAEEVAGEVSTVLGASSEYHGVEIAYSPILQTEHGPELLSKETVDKYISALFASIEESGQEWTPELLLELDTQGLEIDGRLIQGLLADIGATAIKTGEAMHYVGSSGALAQAKENLEAVKTSAKEFLEMTGAEHWQAGLLNILSAFSDILQAIYSGFDMVFGTVEERGSGFKSILARFHDWTIGLEITDERFSAISKSAAIFFSKLKAGGQVLKTVLQSVRILGIVALQTVGSFVEGLFGKNAISKGVKNVTDETKKLAGSLPSIETIIKTIVSTIVTSLPKIKEMAFDIGLSIKVLAAGIMSLIPSLRQAFARGVTDLLNLISGIFPSFQEKAKNISDWFLERVGDIGTNGEKVLPKWNTIFERIRENAGLTASTIGQIFGFEDLDKKIEEFGAKVSGVYAQVKTFFAGLFPSEDTEKIKQGNGELEKTETLLAKVFNFASNPSFPGLSSIVKAETVDVGDMMPSDEAIDQETKSFWSRLSESLTKNFGGFHVDFSRMFEIGKLGVLAYGLYKLGLMVNSFTSLINPRKNGLAGIATALKTTITNIGKPFFAFSKKIEAEGRADEMIKLAAAIGILALAMMGLSMIPEQQLFNVAAVMMGVMLVLKLLAGAGKGISIFSNNAKKTVGDMNATFNVLKDVKASFNSADLKEWFHKISLTANVIPPAMGALIGVAALIGTIGAVFIKIRDIKSYEEVLGAIQVMAGIFIGVGALIAEVGLLGPRMKGVGGTVIAIGIMFALIAQVFIAMNDVEWNLMTFVAIVGSLLVALGLIELVGKRVEGIKNDPFTSGGKLLSLAASIIAAGLLFKLIASSVEDLSTLDPGGVLAASVALFLVAAGLAAIVFAFSKVPKEASMLKAASSMLIMATAIGLMIVPIGVIAAAIKYLHVGTELLEAAAGIAVFMGVMGLIVGLLSKFGGDQLATAAGSLTIASLALVAIAGSIAALGELNPANLAADAMALFALISTLALIMGLLSALPKNMSSNLLVVSVSLTTVSIGLIAIAGALKLLGEIDAGALTNAAFAIAGLFAVLAIALTGMSFIEHPEKMMTAATAMLIGAAAIDVLALGLAGLSYVLVDFVQNSSWDEIGIKAQEMAVALKPIEPYLIGLGVAIGILIVIAAAAGDKLGKFGLGIAGVGIGVLAVVGAFALLPQAVQGIIDAIDLLNNNVSKVAEFVMIIGAIALAAFLEYKTHFVRGMIDTVVSCLEVLSNTATLTKIATALKTIGLFAFTFLMGAMPDLLDKMIVLIVTFFNNLAEAINTHADEIAIAIEKTIVSILNVVIQSFVRLFFDALGWAADMVAKALEWLGLDLGNIDFLKYWHDEGQAMAQTFSDQASHVFDTVNAELEDKGKNAVENYTTGAKSEIENQTPGIAASAEGAIDDIDAQVQAAAAAVGIDAAQAGTDAAASELANGSEDVQNAAAQVGQDSEKALETSFLGNIFGGNLKDLYSQYLGETGAEANDSFLASLSSGLPDFASYGSDAAETTTDAMGGTLEANTGDMLDIIPEQFRGWLSGKGIDLSSIGGDMAGLVTGGAEEALPEGADGIIELTTEQLEAASKSHEQEFKDIGILGVSHVKQGYLDEIKVQAPEMVQQTASDLNDAINANQEEYKVIGILGVQFLSEGYIQEIAYRVPDMIRDTVDGLREAIFNNESDIRYLGQIMFDWTYEGYRQAADQHSPSRVMESEMGYTIDGLVVGAKENAKKAFNAMHDVGDGMMDAMRNSMSRLALAVDRDYDIQPRITPVVDLGPASQGVSALRSMVSGRSMSSILESYRAIDGLAISGATLNYTNQNAPVTSAIHDLSKRMDQFSKSIDEDRNFNVDIRVDNLAVRDDRDIQAISKQLAREVRVALRQKGTR